jgi:ketosteroid isomerase-like protein
MDKVAEGYAQRDLQRFRAAFAPDPDVVMFGTGADEKRVGLDEIEVQAKRDWSQSDSTALAFGWTSVSAAGPVAWLAADVAFRLTADGQELEIPGRLTAVLEKRGEEWLIVQAHFSAPGTAQAEGESFPA